TPSGSGSAVTYAPLSGALAPDQVAVLFLAHAPGSSPACPKGVTPAMTIDTALHGTGYVAVFGIHASAPVVAYDMFPYGGSASAITGASLLLPTSAWDRNYIAVAPYGKGVIQSPYGESWLQILAVEDDTQVTIQPTAKIVGGFNVAPSDQGATVTYGL